jgi:branched-chain amino acid transport system substrate-binding protein
MHRRACAIALALSIACSLSLTACGGHHAHRTPPPHTRRTLVQVYASLPLQGPRAVQARGVLNGIRLALAERHYRAGRWRVHFVALDDATSAGWSALKTAQNARIAASKPGAVYYIGELDSGASEVSGPILNVSGVPQVSPLSTYSALTTGPGVPGPLDPTRTPTFLRLVPSDDLQAGAQLRAAARAGCTRLWLLHDDTPEGTGLAYQLLARRTQFGVQIAREDSLSSVAGAPGTYAAALKAAGVRCLDYAGLGWPDAVRLVSSVAAADPRLQRIFGSDNVCTLPFTGALSPPASSAFRCTSPAGDLASTGAGRAFLAAYHAAYHAVPDPLAVYGYEAMRLGLDTIAGLRARGDDKEAVRDALFAVANRHSVIGTYSFLRDGNTTADSYGLYDVGRGGAPQFVEELSS